MNESTEMLVRELADKLGITAEHLWGVLIRQASITAATDSVIALIMVGLLLALYRLVRLKTTVPPKSEDDRYPSIECEGGSASLSWLILAIYGGGAHGGCCMLLNRDGDYGNDEPRVLGNKTNTTMILENI